MKNIFDRSMKKGKKNLLNKIYKGEYFGHNFTAVYKILADNETNVLIYRMIMFTIIIYTYLLLVNG